MIYVHIKNNKGLSIEFSVTPALTLVQIDRDLSLQY